MTLEPYSQGHIFRSSLLVVAFTKCPWICVAAPLCCTSCNMASINTIIRDLVILVCKCCHFLVRISIGAELAEMIVQSHSTHSKMSSHETGLQCHVTSRHFPSSHLVLVSYCNSQLSCNLFDVFDLCFWYVFLIHTWKVRFSKDKSGAIFYFCYCRQIPRKDPNQLWCMLQYYQVLCVNLKPIFPLCHITLMLSKNY